MIARGVVAAVLLCGAWVGADEPKSEPKKVEELKKALAGKWESADKDKVPLEIGADGTIKVPFVMKNGQWVMAEGTYTVSDAGELRYTAKSGGAKLGGWYKYKDGALTSAMGPKLIVTWKKVAEEKKPGGNE
jgi:uncharacterized protein (TIGR03066 family)